MSVCHVMLSVQAVVVVVVVGAVEATTADVDVEDADVVRKETQTSNTQHNTQHKTTQDETPATGTQHNTDTHRSIEREACMSLMMALHLCGVVLGRGGMD